MISIAHLQSLARRFSIRTCLACAGLVLAVLCAGCGSESPEQLLEEAGTLIQARDVFGAQIKLQQIVEDYPDTELALQAKMGLAGCYRMSRDYEKAYALIDEVVQEVGGPATGLGNQAFILKMKTYEEQERFGDAIDEMIETSPTMHAVPDDGRLYYQLYIAALYLKNEQPDEAIELARALVEGFRGQPQLEIEALETLVGFYTSQDDLESAIAAYGDYLEANPESPNRIHVMTRLGQYNRRLGNDEASRQAFNQAIELTRQQIEESVSADHKTELMMSLAELYKQADRQDEMAPLLERIAQDYPASSNAPMALLRLSALRVEQQNFDEAQAVLDRLASTFPDDPQLQQSLPTIRQWITTRRAQVDDQTSSATATAPTLSAADARTSAPAIAQPEAAVDPVPTTGAPAPMP